MGVEVTYSFTGMHLSQHKFVNKLFDITGLIDTKHAVTPMLSRKFLNRVDCHGLVDPSEYRRLVGLLHYLTLRKTNIAFGVNKLCQFMALPTNFHMIASKRLLRYVSGTL